MIQSALDSWTLKLRSLAPAKHVFIEIFIDLSKTTKRIRIKSDTLIPRRTYTLTKKQRWTIQTGSWSRPLKHIFYQISQLCIQSYLTDSNKKQLPIRVIDGLQQTRMSGNTEPQAWVRRGWHLHRAAVSPSSFIYEYIWVPAPY